MGEQHWQSGGGTALAIGWGNSTGCPLSWLPQLSSIMVTSAVLCHGYRSCPLSWLPQLSSYHGYRSCPLIMVTAAVLYHGYRSCLIMVTDVAPSAVSWT